MLRLTLSLVIIFLMGASFVFSARVSAHNTSLKTARANVHDYAIKVLDDKHNPYQRFHLNCANAFTGHNHYVRCTVKYYNDFKSDSPVACTEKIEVYFQSHNLLHGENYTYYTRHTSRPCGSLRMM